MGILEKKPMSETKSNRGAKKAAILSLYNSGITKASEIAEALKAQGVETSKNNIYVVLAELRKPAETSNDGATETTGQSKSDLIRAELAAGNTKVSDIVKKLALNGVTVSAALVHSIKGKTPSAKTSKVKTAAKPAKAKTETKETSSGVHPDLLKLMQAAALQFGSGAVSAAASHVDARSREMIKATFGG